MEEEKKQSEEDKKKELKDIFKVTENQVINEMKPISNKIQEEFKIEDELPIPMFLRPEKKKSKTKKKQ